MCYEQRSVFSSSGTGEVVRAQFWCAGCFFWRLDVDKVLRFKEAGRLHTLEQPQTRTQKFAILVILMRILTMSLWLRIQREVGMDQFLAGRRRRFCIRGSVFGGTSAGGTSSGGTSSGGASSVGRHRVERLQVEHHQVEHHQVELAMSYLQIL